MRWTAQILEEAIRNLVEDRTDEVQIRRRFDAMRAHFKGWEITGYEDLIPSMTCDEKDRHVLAAAVRGGVDQIVTADIDDFPGEAVDPYGIEVVPPDEFLLNVLHVCPNETLEVVREQAAALRRPPLTVNDVLATLSRCGARQFASEAATVIAGIP